MVFILLPAYNESKNIPPLLDKIRALSQSLKEPCRVIVVDDGSSDRTGEAAKSSAKDLDLHLETHPVNRGLAEALRTGFNAILSLAQPNDWVAVMDADNSHDPALIARMLAQAGDSFDGAIASRYVEGSDEVGLSFLRRFLSGTCNGMLRLFFPIPGVRDYTSGYRLVRVKRLRELQSETGSKFFDAQGFVCTSELLLRLAALGTRFTEVPLVLRYDLKLGQSKMKIARTVRDYLAMFLLRKNLRKR